MRFLKTAALAAGALVATAAFAMSAAGSTDGGAIVKLGPSSLGRVLVDAHGKTLYLWAHDKGSKSSCYGDCAEYWPPLTTHGRPLAVAGAQPKLLGTTRRSDGATQVTYAGHPLYSFVQDRKAGQVKGEGLTGFGGRWDPLSAIGQAVRTRIPASTGSYGTPAAAGAYGTPAAAGTYGSSPLAASIISPQPGDRAGVGGTFSVELSLQARNARGNNLLAGYTAAFNDPSKPSFHPGPNAAAPGLVVLLSTTPTVANTPLQGPNTNLAGVFQVNDVSRAYGLKRTFNSWIVTSPGFFGKAKQATLTVYAVQGAAPALITGTEQPISNVVRERFTIAG
jgi:predicted lipoprotein with Yx(FWY)xxD motif